MVELFYGRAKPGRVPRCGAPRRTTRNPHGFYPPLTLHRHASEGRWRWFAPALLVIAWLALGGAGGPFAGKLAEVSENDNSTFLPASAESTQVNELQPQFSGGRHIPAFIVAERDDGISGADQQYLQASLERIRGIEGVAQVSPPVPSPDDDQALQMVVAIDGEADPTNSVSAMRAALEQSPAGLTTLAAAPPPRPPTCPRRSAGSTGCCCSSPAASCS